MIVYFYICLFIFGACIASFVNVVIDRVPKGEQFVSGRSHCDACGHTLAWYDLIPIISYVVYRGKCHYCGAKIGMRQWWLEIVGGLLSCFCFYKYQFSLMTIGAFALGEILIAISFIDIDTMEIPDGLNIALAVVAIFFAFIDPSVSIISRIIGFFIVSGFMFLVCCIKEGAFGGGDIKMIAVLGFLLGWQMVLVGSFIAIVSGGIYAAILLLTHNIKLQEHMAFGPFLAAGCYIALLYGPQILNSYLSLYGL